jgi:SAM-dependent methyltransferase
MKPSAVSSLRCPLCKPGVLTTESEAVVGDEIVQGRLRCTSCGSRYPIEGGVPRFVEVDNYTGSFGLQWLAHRRTQLDSATGLQISRSRLFQVTSWPNELRGERVLEAGSGAGRFTEILASTGATVYSFDYSRAVEANFSNNGGHPNVHLFQANIFSIPVEEASFDRVICLGVLQHTPDPARAFRALTRCVKPGGHLAIDVYTRSLAALLQWKYVLRPLTKRIGSQRLYGIVQKVVPPLVPITAALRKIAGRAGARLSPIVEYSHLGLSPKLSREWAVLDTFDMYSPVHDHPQTIETVRRWFTEAGFEGVHVARGPNGVVGRGRRLAAAKR